MQNIEVLQINNAISFSNLLENENRVNFKNLLCLLANFKKIYDVEKAKLPFHINIIDELHADENAHSRIFAKLLRYKINGKYPFLNKFLNELCGFNLTVDKPEVRKVDSCGRIDIPIFDKKYVVVIENKVTGKAREQNNDKGGQLARYIETINKDYGKELKSIFIIFTPKYSEEPSDDCWLNKENKSYKKEFQFRFRSLSYRDKIYPWLKNEILPIIDTKDKFLLSAIEQYIDHLEGNRMFSIRTINKKMNMNLQEFIKKELGLEENNPAKAIEVLSEKESELNNAITQIQLLKSKYNKQIVMEKFKEWKELLKKDFPNLKIVGDQFKVDKAKINLGVVLTIENKSFAVEIEWNDCNKPNIYFGLAVNGKEHKMPKILDKILDENKFIRDKDVSFYGRKYSSLENGYLRLKNLIKECNIQN